MTTEILNRKEAPAVTKIGPLQLPPMETITLSNGLTFNLINSDSGPDVTRLTVLTSGGRAENDGAVDKFALAALLARMGTRSFTEEQLADILDFNGAWTSVGRHQHSTDRRFYMLNSKVEALLPAISEIISAPTFPEHATRVEIEKEARRMELDAKRVSRRAHAAMLRRLYGDTPLGLTPTGDELRAVSPSDLAATHARACNPLYMTAWLAGRLTPAIVDAFGRMLENIEAKGSGVERKTEHIITGDTEITRVEMPDARQSAINAFIPLPDLNRFNPQYTDLRATVTALGGYFGSRLMLNVREDRGLTYGIESQLAGYADTAYLNISTECDTAFVDEVCEQIRAEVANLANEESYTPDEIERLGMYEATELAGGVEDAFHVSDNYQNIVELPAPADYYARNWHTATHLSPRMLAATAARWLNPEQLGFVIAGN